MGSLWCLDDWRCITLPFGTAPVTGGWREEGRVTLGSAVMERERERSEGGKREDRGRREGDR